MAIRDNIILLALLPMALLADSWRTDRAQLCFVRPENNGAINILNSWVRVSGYRLPLLGGQSACLFVAAGNTELVVTSTIPYNRASKDEEACKSRPMKLEVSPLDNRVFFIWPTANHDHYTCGWSIEPVQPERNVPKGKDRGATRQSQ